jgi:hypothetical protein
MKPIRAVYEDGVFRPLEPVSLADHSEVLVESAAGGYPRSREAVIRVLRQHLPRLRDQYGVGRLILYGSMARDEAGIESDVDLAVEFNRPVALMEQIDLAGDLTYLLGRLADLHVLSALKPRIRHAAEQEGIEL